MTPERIDAAREIVDASGERSEGRRQRVQARGDGLGLAIRFARLRLAVLSGELPAQRVGLSSGLLDRAL